MFSLVFITVLYQVHEEKDKFRVCRVILNVLLLVIFVTIPEHLLKISKKVEDLWLVRELFLSHSEIVFRFPQHISLMYKQKIDIKRSEQFLKCGIFSVIIDR